MGMYNYVEYKTVCPVCSRVISRFQTKDGDNLFMVTVKPNTVSNFYSSCACGHWLEFTRNGDGQFVRTVARMGDDDYSILPEYQIAVTIDSSDDKFLSMPESLRNQSNLLAEYKTALTAAKEVLEFYARTPTLELLQDAGSKATNVIKQIKDVLGQ